MRLRRSACFGERLLSECDADLDVVVGVSGCGGVVDDGVDDLASGLTVFFFFFGEELFDDFGDVDGHRVAGAFGLDAGASAGDEDSES